MDEPVTDIVFVSSKENCPKGYRIVSSNQMYLSLLCLCIACVHVRFVGLCVQIETCPSGHEAQMWEKVLGGESGERYLCFSKEDKVGPVNWVGWQVIKLEKIVNY